ncbi:hypothetical protein JCM10207_000101 [Rhodosporidiobolus poonsookiae]
MLLGPLARQKRMGATALFPVVSLLYIAYRLLSPSNRSNDYASDGPRRSPFAVQTGSRQAGVAAAANATVDLLGRLLKVPDEEVGRLCICASVFNEGRFLTEWLLYHRSIGVDRFYLYDTGSTDETLEVLQPWMEAGTVKLHRFNQDPGTHFQLNSLETCSRTYASQSDWIIDADVDEFYVVPHSLYAGRKADALSPQSMPDKPLQKILYDNWLYQTADVVAASRVTWKNAGIKRMKSGQSVLGTQTLRDVYHSIKYAKLEYTKSLVHTRRTPGWVIPGAHHVLHESLAASDAKIISADGQTIKPEERDALAETPEGKGTFYQGRIGWRTFEPIIMWHFVERDLDNCLAKLARASVVRKGGWRDQAGENGCKSYELYQPDEEWKPVFERDSFYGAAVKDNTMADSWYGQNLPSLIRASLLVARRIARGTVRDDDLPFQPVYVDPHPDMVKMWTENGRDPITGESEEEGYVPLEKREKREQLEKREEAEPKRMKRVQVKLT